MRIFRTVIFDPAIVGASCILIANGLRKIDVKVYKNQIHAVKKN